MKDARLVKVASPSYRDVAVSMDQSMDGSLRGRSSAYRLRKRTAGVDQLANGVGVVVEVDGQGILSNGRIVVGDQGLEVVGDLLGIGLGHASSVVALEHVSGRDGDERRSSEGCEGVHLVGFSLVCFVSFLGWSPVGSCTTAEDAELENGRIGNERVCARSTEM